MKQFTLNEMAQVLPDGNKKIQLLNLDSLRLNLLNPICERIENDVELLPSSEDEQSKSGEAVNLSAGTFTDNKKLFATIKGMFIEFDRLGYHEEKSDNGNRKNNWISISYRKGRNRNQVIVGK